MLKIISAACLTLLVASIGIVPAQAATVTVAGTGSYEKLVVNNGNKNLVFKIHAPGGECDIKYLAVKFRDRDGTRYGMDGGCYPGSTWGAGLTRGKRESTVDCSKFTLKFNATNSVWTGKIPRTCLEKLGGAIKVTQSWVDDFSPEINEVTGTKYVRRG